MSESFRYQDRNTTKYRNYFVLILITSLISFVNWPDIILSGTQNILQDREVYVYKILTKDTIFDYVYFDSYVKYFTSEYTWAFLMKLMQDGDLPVQYETVFQIISTLFIVTSTMIVYRRGGLLPLIFLANPLVFELAYSQLRSGLAISIVYIAFIFFRRSYIVAVSLCLFAATIHTTMIIFLAAYILCVMTADDGRLSRLPDETRLMLIMGAGFVVGLAIGPLRETLLTLIGDRRAEYLDLSSSALYLSFWVGLLGLFVVNFRDIFRSVEGRFSILILSIVAVNVFTGGYSLRFLALAYPFIISTILLAKPSVQMFAIPGLSIYMVAQWIYYLSNLS